MKKSDLLKIAKPILFNTNMVRAIVEGRKTQTRRARRAPNCKKGDILYVRETWHKDVGRYLYRANYADNEKFYINGREIDIKWHPSIHMPKEAARIFLKVIDVHIERLQDIDDYDAKCEGVGRLFLEDIAYSGKDYGCDWNNKYGLAKEQFAWLWDSTTPKRLLDKYGWNANPYVMVIEFERVKTLD